MEGGNLDIRAALLEPGAGPLLAQSRDHSVEFRAVDWPVEAVERKWAGLRSFAPDRAMIFGFDRQVPGFFWCAGQGGMGIQTAPAASLLCAALIRGEEPPEELAGIDPAHFSPARFA